MPQPLSLTGPLGDDDTTAVAAAATDIVVAYVGANHMAVADLPGLIQAVRSALNGLSKPAKPERQPQEPAVNLKRLVTPDFIFCAECGLKFKSLKRHIGSEHDLTPQAYRAKWGLKSDSPMVAPNYAATRSALAKSMGLGRKAEPPPPPKPARAAKALVAEAAPAPAPAPKATVKKSRPNPKPSKANPVLVGPGEGGGKAEPMFED